MNELKPCPFCGGGADYIQILGNYERPHEVYCFTCDGGITEGRSKDGVIHNWNTRPIEDELRKRIADLEKDNDEFRQLIRDWSIVLDQNCDFQLWQVESVRQAMLEVNKERDE